ncbi:MAG TPA: asparagine synthetase B, partial [Deltaproteobacteria bacterium]|nr:asparagine synthetase B [Deltaproteobacteria bacterium]
MCGIFGVTHAGWKDGPWEAAVESIAHRGPDGHGSHVDDTVFLGHRRLSIIDLETGGQPIYNEDRTMCIVCNGEIYNFQELRHELAARGHVFSTRSDTETVLHAYEEWGEACVERLRGMFAFAVWDIRKRELFIARDKFGIKPLFYGQHKGRFYFASEIKAILADPGYPRDMDEGA